MFSVFILCAFLISILSPISFISVLVLVILILEHILFQLVAKATSFYMISFHIIFCFISVLFQLHVLLHNE